LPCPVAEDQCPQTFAPETESRKAQPAGGSRPASTKEFQPMLDVLMLILGIGFFALSVTYALACERL
jgi:hypothetical protein